MYFFHKVFTSGQVVNKGRNGKSCLGDKYEDVSQNTSSSPSILKSVDLMSTAESSAVEFTVSLVTEICNHPYTLLSDPDHLRNYSYWPSLLNLDILFLLGRA